MQPDLWRSDKKRSHMSFFGPTLRRLVAIEKKLVV
jgi:hypothetical protein